MDRNAGDEHRNDEDANLGYGPNNIEHSLSKLSIDLIAAFHASTKREEELHRTVKGLETRLEALTKSTKDTETRLVEQNNTLKNRIAALEGVIRDPTDPLQDVSIATLSPHDENRVQGSDEIITQPAQTLNSTVRRSDRTRNSISSMIPDRLGLIRPTKKAEYSDLIRSRKSNGSARIPKVQPKDVVESIEENRQLQPITDTVEEDAIADDCRSPSPELSGWNDIDMELDGPGNLQPIRADSDFSESITAAIEPSPMPTPPIDEALKSPSPPANVEAALPTLPTLPKLDKQVYLNDWNKHAKDSGITLEEYVQSQKDKLPTPRKRRPALEPYSGAAKNKGRKKERVFA